MTITTRGEAIAKLRLSMSAPDLERLKTMERLKGRYITTSWDAQLLRSINQLIATVGTCKVLAGEATEYSRETRALVVIGEAGTGKTESLNRIFQTHPALTGYGTPGSGCPLRSVSVPAPCTSKALGNAILRAVDYPVARELKEHVLWALVQEKLADAGVLLLHLDEMHNLTSNANITQIDNIRKTLKSLMVSPQWPIGLIISGLPELAPEMQAIDELRRRGRFLRRPLLVAPGDVDLVRGI